MKPRAIYILIMVIAFWIDVKGQNHHFRHYSNAEGFPNSFVYDLEQDEQGYLWIGTPDGLYKFNGLEFNLFTVEDGLANDFVTRIFSDSKGRVWIGHQDGNISLLIDDEFIILNQQSAGTGMVTDLAEDHNGSIWFSSQNQGLARIDKDLGINAVSFPIENELLTQIEIVGEDLFLIGTQENLYYTTYNSNESSMSIVSHYENYPGSKVVDIFPDTQGGYIVVSQEDGLYHLLPDTIQGSFRFNEIDGNPDGALDYLQGGLVDSNGRLWLNTMGDGLIQYKLTPDNQYIVAERISTANGLVSDDIRTIFEDQEGNIWCGLYGDGLLRYLNNNLKFYNYSIEGQAGGRGTFALTGDSANFLAVSGNRIMWINPSADSILNTYSLPEKGIGDRVSTAFLADDGIIWLGYEQSGLYRLDLQKKQFKSVFISNDALSNSINHITGKGEAIWVSTKKGVFLINRSTGTMKWFTTNDGLPHNNIKQIFIDSKGKVLIGTLCSELFYINKDQDIRVLENSEIGPQNSVVSFQEDSYGTLWVATLGNGLWRISEDTVKNYTSSSGLYSDFCYSLAITEQGYPIIGHTGGISLINLESNIIRTYSQLEGVSSSSEFYPNAIHKDPLGNVWFGTSDGLVKYSSGIAKGGLIPPGIRITGVKVDGQYVDHMKSPILLKPGRYEISVDYIGLSFTNPELVFYQTKLEGYSREWSLPTFDRTIIFDRVDHGHYSFMIKAYNENEISSILSPAFELRIKKPAYLSIWFYAIIFLLLGTGFYALLQIRERNHKMVQERLLRNLDEQSKEIIVKEEIIKERKKVEKVLIEAKTKAELSEKLKTSFLQNMSHEIRTPMNAIVGFSGLLKEEGLPEDNRDEFIKHISNNAESLLQLIDDILDVSKLETNQLAINVGACELHPMIKDLNSIYMERLIEEGKDEIKLSVITPPDEKVEIKTDAIRLKQVMVKLLDNAVKFTESGEIRFGFSLEPEQVLFFVEDTGIGLSEDKKEVIFDLFRKIEEDKLKLYGGTGLGLTLARYLVHLMGGEIDVESHEGFGSKFFITLPYQIESDKSKPAESE